MHLDRGSGRPSEVLMPLAYLRSFFLDPLQFMKGPPPPAWHPQEPPSGPLQVTTGQ